MNCQSDKLSELSLCETGNVIGFGGTFPPCPTGSPHFCRRIEAHGADRANTASSSGNNEMMAGVWERERELGEREGRRLSARAVRAFHVRPLVFSILMTRARTHACEQQALVRVRRLALRRPERPTNRQPNRPTVVVVANIDCIRLNDWVALCATRVWLRRIHS